MKRHLDWRTIFVGPNCFSALLNLSVRDADIHARRTLLSGLHRTAPNPQWTPTVPGGAVLAGGCWRPVPMIKLIGTSDRFFYWDRFAEGLFHGTDVISAAGAAGSLADLFSINNCPATNIIAANAIANIAVAHWWTSFILRPVTKIPPIQR